jgi:hydroxypyruvate reductase
MHAPSSDTAANGALYRSQLRGLFDAALMAVDPAKRVAAALPPPPRGRTIVLGAGKASARMAQAVDVAWQGPLSGLVVTRYGHGAACDRIEIVEAGHPVPDAAGEVAARRVLDLASTAGPDDLVIVLMSGGGSSLLTVPAPGVTTEELRQVNRALLQCGAPIGEVNTVRRHLSAIKGGRLAKACGRARLVTLVVSDVPGDDPAVVASGPTVPDSTTPATALSILQDYGIPVAPSVRSVLTQRGSVLLDPSVEREVKVVAAADMALRAAHTQAELFGFEAINLGGALEGESREVAATQAGLALGLQLKRGGRPRVLLSGGETTVTVRGKGRGGRNSEFLLALALALNGAQGVVALACDTDGIDGVEDNAGGLIDSHSLRRAGRMGLNPSALLRDNDAYTFLERLDDLIITGPTRTNVNDFRAIIVE